MPSSERSKLLLKFGVGSFNDRIRLPMPTGKTYTGISAGEIAYVSPSGDTGSWAATFDDSDESDPAVYYDTASGDLSEEGIWRLTPSAGEIVGQVYLLEAY